MADLLCEFAAGDDGWCRCVRPGCKNKLRSTEPEKCRAKCRSEMASRDLLNHPCQHLGEVTGETYKCKGCPGSPRVHALFACEIHGKCLPLTGVKGARSCGTCDDYVAS